MFGVVSVTDQLRPSPPPSGLRTSPTPGRPLVPTARHSCPHVQPPRPLPHRPWPRRGVCSGRPWPWNHPERDVSLGPPGRCWGLVQVTALEASPALRVLTVAVTHVGRPFVAENSAAGTQQRGRSCSPRGGLGHGPLSTQVLVPRPCERDLCGRFRSSLCVRGGTRAPTAAPSR